MLHQRRSRDNEAYVCTALFDGFAELGKDAVGFARARRPGEYKHVLSV